MSKARYFGMYRDIDKGIEEAMATIEPGDIVEVHQGYCTVDEGPDAECCCVPDRIVKPGPGRN